jgi:hypothetical protein
MDEQKKKNAGSLFERISGRELRKIGGCWVVVLFFVFPFAFCFSSFFIYSLFFSRRADIASQKAMIEMLRGMLKGGGGGGDGGAGGAGASKADGEHSTTPGPAPCKLKHWYEGREVDYVLKFAVSDVVLSVLDLF